MYSFLLKTRSNLPHCDRFGAACNNVLILCIDLLVMIFTVYIYWIDRRARNVLRKVEVETNSRVWRECGSILFHVMQRPCDGQATQVFPGINHSLWRESKDTESFEEMHIDLRDSKSSKILLGICDFEKNPAAGLSSKMTLFLLFKVEPQFKCL